MAKEIKKNSELHCGVSKNQEPSICIMKLHKMLSII